MGEPAEHLLFSLHCSKFLFRLSAETAASPAGCDVTVSGPRQRVDSPSLERTCVPSPTGPFFSSNSLLRVLEFFLLGSLSVPSRFLSQPPVSHLRRLISATAGERRQVFTPSRPRAAATPADPSSSRVSTRGTEPEAGRRSFSGFGSGTDYMEWEQSGTCRSWAAQQSDGGGARTCCPMMHRGHLEGVRREGRRFPAPPCDGETTDNRQQTAFSRGR